MHKRNKTSASAYFLWELSKAYKKEFLEFLRYVTAKSKNKI